MALFSRRPKGASDQPTADEVPDSDETAAAADADTSVATAPDDGGAEGGASIDISVSSFQGFGARAEAPRWPSPRASGAEAPPPTQTVPGLRDNVLVREALASLSDPPSPQEVLNVARQLLQGHLFLRVKGDARTLLSEGKPLPLSIATVADRSYALAYSSGAALQASIRSDGDVDTSAMGQPVVIVIRHVLAGPYEGLIVDHASAPARAVLPRALLEKVLEKFDESLTLKTLLAEERTPATAVAVAEALTRVPLWVAVGRGEGDRLGIAEGRGPDGSRLLEVYSHPLEVAAMGRSDQPAPLTGAQLGGALRSDEGLVGVILDPRGPWIALSRDELAPVIALAG